MRNELLTPAGTATAVASPRCTVEPDTLFVSQPKPASGDLANDPALGVVDAHPGVVIHDSRLGSPKRLRCVAASGRADDGERDGPGPGDQAIGG